MSGIKFDGGGLRPLQISKLDSEMESTWIQWRDSFDIALQVNGITDPIRKKLQLLHQGGMDLQKIYKNLPSEVNPVNAENDVYKIAIQQLNKYFVSRKVHVVERLKFRAIAQGNDSIDDFVLKLKEQAKKCDLEGQVLEVYMIDQIVDKCSSNELKKRFFEKNLSLEEVIISAKAFEMAQQTVKTFRPDPPKPLEVNQIKTTKKRFCYCCGSPDHISSFENCPGKKAFCENCKTKGHMTKCCIKLKRKATNQFKQQPEKKFKNEKINSIDFHNKESAEEEYLFALDKVGEDLEVEIGDVKVKIMIDSGATCNVLTEETWKIMKDQRVKVREMQKSSANSIKPYGCNQSLEILGSFKADVKTEISKKEALFYVVRGGPLNLLGRNLSVDLGILKLGLDVNAIISSTAPFPKMKGILIHLPIDKSVTPVVQRYRRTPIPLTELVVQKLKELERLDIIEKVDEPAEWVSPMVIVFKGT